MLEYCRISGRNNRSNVLMDFIRRIEANASGIRSMVETSIEKEDSSVHLKLPIGLLVRGCIADAIQGLYLSSLTAEDANEEIGNLNQDYVRSLPDRFEVYLDRTVVSEMDIELLKNMYGLGIEDTFSHYIDFESTKDGFFVIKKTKKHCTIRSMVDCLCSSEQNKELAKKLYSYFREYSQYEHFSQMGHGDSLVPFDEDCTVMAKAFEYVSVAAFYIQSNIVSPAVPTSFLEKSIDGINHLLKSFAEAKESPIT